MDANTSEIRMQASKPRTSPRAEMRCDDDTRSELNLAEDEPLRCADGTRGEASRAERKRATAPRPGWTRVVVLAGAHTEQRAVFPHPFFFSVAEAVNLNA
jgi:hypothetical protein